MQKDYKVFNDAITNQDKIDFSNTNQPDNWTEISFAASKFVPLAVYLLFGIFIFFMIAVFIDLCNIAFEAYDIAFEAYVFLSFIIFIANLIVGCRKLLKKSEVSVKLYKFAKDNELQYFRYELEPFYSGVIFNTYGQSLDVLRDATGKKFEIANYIYSRNDRLGLSENGYVMITLDKNLPNMILDSRHNNKIRSGSIGRDRMIFGKNQQLSLEGDFDKYFALYAPKDYENDALYIFTPDLMLLFMDESNTFDAEIVDNKLFIYSKSPFDFGDRAVLERIFSIIDIVGNKMRSRSEKYSDERISRDEQNIIGWDCARLNVKTSMDIFYKILVFVVIAMVVFLVGLVVFAALNKK